MIPRFKKIRGKLSDFLADSRYERNICKHIKKYVAENIDKELINLESYSDPKEIYSALKNYLSTKESSLTEPQIKIFKNLISKIPIITITFSYLKDLVDTDSKVYALLNSNISIQKGLASKEINERIASIKTIESQIPACTILNFIALLDEILKLEKMTYVDRL